VQGEEMQAPPVASELVWNRSSCHRQISVIAKETQEKARVISLRLVGVLRHRLSYAASLSLPQQSTPNFFVRSHDVLMSLSASFGVVLTRQWFFIWNPKDNMPVCLVINRQYPASDAFGGSVFPTSTCRRNFVV